MARTVDPERHEARRLAIVDAALTCFARHGYEGATTSIICAEAGIGSGTFFHYFPTKLDVLLALLDLGTAETRDWFAGHRESTHALEVIEGFVRHSAREMDDPRAPGLVRAVGSVMSQPDVAAALERDTVTLREALRPWVARAQSRGEIRRDMSAQALVVWIQAVLDGYLSVIAAEDDLDPTSRREALMDVVRRILRDEEAGTVAAGP